MIPILYETTEEAFTSMGVGLLEECTRCVVTEEVNGIYECEFDYPCTGPMYEYLLNMGGIVSVEHDHNGDRQAFDIYKYSAPIEGVVTFYASHVSYRLNSGIAQGGTAYGTPAKVFEFISDPPSIDGLAGVRFAPNGPFTFTDYSGYTSDGTTLWNLANYASFREILMGREEPTENMNGSVLQIWPGEYVFDNFAVKYYKKRGSDNGVQIRYGKNMSSVTRERSTESLISVVFPYAITEEYETFVRPVYSPYVETSAGFWTTAAGDFMRSGGEQLFFKAAILRAAAIDFTDLFETEPTDEQLEKAARDYMSKNSTWRADDNITVEFVDLYNSPEYQSYKSLERCSLGDFVDIYYPELGIVSENVEIMSVTYDVLNERFTEMQLNTIRTTLAQTIIDYIGGKQ